MKSKQIVPVTHRNYLLCLALAALVLSMTGRVWSAEAIEGVSPESDGPMAAPGVSAWNLSSYNEASPELMTHLQAFLLTDNGAQLVSHIPIFGIIKKLNPNSEAHRRIVGALNLSADLQSQLKGDRDYGEADEETISFHLANAYLSEDFKNKIILAAKGRAEQVITAAKQDKMSLAQLSQASDELAPFALVSEKVRDVMSMAQTKKMEYALRIANALASPN